MKHPHPGRIAEVYRKTGDGLKYIGYTAGPFSDDRGFSVHPDYSHEQYQGAVWDEDILGWILPQRQRPTIDD